MFEVDSRDVAPLLEAGFVQPTPAQLEEHKKEVAARAKMLEDEAKRLEAERNDPAHPNYRDPNLPSDPRFQMTAKEAAEAATRPPPGTVTAGPSTVTHGPSEGTAHVTPAQHPAPTNTKHK